jgi:hypothetical protein
MNSHLRIMITMIIFLVIMGAAWTPSSSAHGISTTDCRLVARYTEGSVYVKRASAAGCMEHRSNHLMAHRIQRCSDAYPSDYRPRNACTIRAVFGAQGDKAVAVSWCESSLRTWADNGEHEGLFQVSSNWRRSISGFGPSAREQAVHALKVFRAVGSRWSPTWDCG